MKILNRKQSESSNENGKETVSTATDIFFTQDKEKKLKKELFLKFFLSLILTNTITYLLFAPVDKTVVAIKRKHNDNEKILTLKIHSFVPLNGKEKVVSLYTSANSQIVERVTLIKKIESEDFDSDLGQKYQVSVQDTDIEKILQHKDSTLFAFPIIKITSTGEKPYEINF